MNNIKKIFLVTAFILAGIPALVSQLSGGNNNNFSNAVFAYEQEGYYRFDETCYYQCGTGLCTGSQCNVSGSGCNFFNACSA